MEGSAVTTTQVLIDNNQLGKLWTLGEASRNISYVCLLCSRCRELIGRVECKWQEALQAIVAYNLVHAISRYI